MEVIVITLPEFFEGETARVNRLFSEGMARLHLRKPWATEAELAAWIEEIEPVWRPRIVLHDHHALARRYALGGIHLNGRNPEAPTWAREEGFSISRSCHSLDEVARHKDACNYVFLSPIYDSISKEGYGRAFTPTEIEDAHKRGIIDSKVYALGGVTPAHLPELEKAGFGGAAMLGAVWKTVGRTISAQPFFHS